jgi:hypothetical protein
MEAAGGCFVYPRVGGFASDPAQPGLSYCSAAVLAMAGPFTGQVVWVCVVGHARCGGDRRDPGQRSPVRVQIGKARQEAAAAIVGDTTGQVAGVGDLAGVRAATGAGAGLADASRITPRS